MATVGERIAVCGSEYGDSEDPRIGRTAALRLTVKRGGMTDYDADAHIASGCLRALVIDHNVGRGGARQQTGRVCGVCDL